MEETSASGAIATAATGEQHSGPHPVIVSGWGTSFPKHLQIGFPSLLAMHMVPGPQGLGSQGSGFKTHLEEVVN